MPVTQLLGLVRCKRTNTPLTEGPQDIARRADLAPFGVRQGERVGSGWSGPDPLGY